MFRDHQCCGFNFSSHSFLTTCLCFFLTPFEPHAVSPDLANERPWGVVAAILDVMDVRCSSWEAIGPHIGNQTNKARLVAVSVDQLKSTSQKMTMTREPHMIEAGHDLENQWKEVDMHFRSRSEVDPEIILQTHRAHVSE